MSDNESEEPSDSKTDFDESFKFLLEKLIDLKEPLSKVHLDQEFLARGGSLTSDFCWNKWSSYHGYYVYSMDIDMDTKVKILFALSIFVDYRFQDDLKRGARLETDKSRRITLYEKKDGGLLLSGKHGDDLLNEQYRRFLTKKAKTTVSRFSWSQFVEEFKTETGTKKKIDGLKTRYYDSFRKPFNYANFSFKTKIRLSFWTQSELSKQFLKELRRVGSVDIDEKQRIIHYRSNSGHLVLDRDNWFSTNEETKMWERIDARFNGDNLIEHPNDIQSLRFEKEMAEFIKFLWSISEKVASPIGSDLFCSQYEAFTDSSISTRDVTNRINQLRNHIQEMKTFDREMQVRTMFRWRIPVTQNYLEELQKDAIVTLNKNDQISKYESNDGSFKLPEEAVAKSGRVSQKRKHISDISYKQKRNVESNGQNSHNGSELDLNDSGFDSQTPEKSVAPESSEKIAPKKDSVVIKKVPKVKKGRKPIISEPEETMEVALAATKVAPSLSVITPASVKAALTTAKVAPPTAKIAPATTKIAPSLPEVASPTTKIAPVTVKATPSFPQVARTTLKVAPSALITKDMESEEADGSGSNSDKGEEDLNNKENVEENFKTPRTQRITIKIPTDLIKATLREHKRKVREDELGLAEKKSRIEDEDQVTVSERIDVYGEARDEGSSEIVSLTSQEVVIASPTPEATVSGPTEDPMTPAHPEEDQMEFEQNLELERTGPATSTPFNPTLYFDDDFENLMKTPDTSRGVPKGLDSFNLDLFNGSFSAEIGTINRSDYPLYLGNGITDEEAPESSTSQTSSPEGSIPLGAHRRLLESIQTLILYLDLPNFERIQRKIEKTLEKINEFSAPVEASEVKIAVDLCISIANRSETPSPDEDYRSLHNFLNFIRSSIIPMKLPQFETIIQTLNEKSLNQDRRISVDRIQLSLTPIIGIITC